ncbi:MAG: protein kinase, partial [Deltaproteobacteria bacterium]|nr:protein kinase [Deltaproteobacteria bacterium]
MAAGDDDTIAGSPYTAEAAAAIPALVAGRYQIVRWLGAGGMGRVYDVLDTELGEHVALKMLRGDIDDEALARFRREVRLTRKIQHPNIARMFDIGETGGERFLTMELVEGESLTACLGKPLSWGRLQKLAVQICAGLAAAHDKGVIHRDLKPDNVLVEASTDRAVITDFGIARGTGDTQGNVTQTGMIVGTPRYMAPEQLAGRTTDERSDLFSLGVMLYELASGTRPWPGDNAIAIAVAQVTQPMQPLATRGVPAAFSAIVERMLAVEPEQRPSSAAAVGASIAALANAITEQTAEAHAIAPHMHAVMPVAEQESTIAVLPFTCSGDDAYLADGMREDLIDMLSTTPGLRVRPAGTLDPQIADPRASGRELGVDHVVTGTIRRNPSGLRVAARLVGVADGFQIWAHRIDCNDGDVLVIGDQLGRAIASALSTRATNRHAMPTDPRAVELFLRARAELRRFWGDHALTASKLLEEAAQLAPSSGPIAGLLACATALAWAKLNQPDLLDRARRYIDRGLALDHPDAYLAASHLHWNLGELEAGAHDLRVVLERAPMSGLAHEMAGRLLLELDLGSASRYHLDNAIALDPTRATIIASDLCRLEALDGNFDKAAEIIANIFSDPDPSVQQFATMMELRLAVWREDGAGLIHALDRHTLRLPAVGMEIGNIMRVWRDTGTFDRETWQRTLTALSPSNRPRRMQLTIIQRTIEIAAMLGQIDCALEGLRVAVGLGIADIVWLDRCPNL